MTAVVCDDEPAKRAAVVGLLEQAGVTVVLQASSLQHLKTLVTDPAPDVVVLDLALAGMAGLEVVRELHTEFPSCALLVLSPFTALRPDALVAGARALVDVHDLRELETALAALHLPLPRGAADADADADATIVLDVPGQATPVSGNVRTNPSEHDSSPPMARA